MARGAETGTRGVLADVPCPLDGRAPSEVDSAGKCLPEIRSCPRRVLRDTAGAKIRKLLAFLSRYKFHLALENAICD